MPPRLLPAELFKYSKWAHAEALIRWGKIRVGTLDDYRNIEKHSSLIGDKDEGQTSLFDDPLFATGETLSAFSARWVPGFTGPGMSGVTFVGCYFNEPKRSPNCWLYCMSERLSLRVMDSFEANYDACVRIPGVSPFFMSIWQELARHRPIAGGGIIPVTYRRRSLHYGDDDGLHPIEVKAPGFAPQVEVRFVYFPAQEITEPYLDLTIPGLKAFCEPLWTSPGDPRARRPRVGQMRAAPRSRIEN
jgi:hypothetical protein